MKKKVNIWNVLQDITSIQSNKTGQMTEGEIYGYYINTMAAGIDQDAVQESKQRQKMGPNGEIIMDYSIRDAKEAGFNKVVFIIRKEHL